VTSVHSAQASLERWECQNHRRIDPFDRPADALLLLLRERGPDAYRVQGPHQWIARCPLCAERRLTVRERGTGGDVTVDCGNGCDPSRALAVLTAAPDPLAEAWGLVDRLLSLAHEQQHLLRQVVGVDQQRPEVLPG
jgi:hypothetical protein